MSYPRISSSDRDLIRKTAIQRSKPPISKAQKMDPALVQRPPSKRITPAPAVIRPISIKQSYPWQNWESIVVEVNMLPYEETTYNLWKNFERFGTIVSLEIFENRGKKGRRGKIRFSPPPSEPFWSPSGKRAHIKCTSEDESRQYLVEVDPRMNDPLRIQSPINKNVFYNPMMKLSVKSLKFGIMISPVSIMSLSKTEESITLSLDLRKRQIIAHFSFKFKDPRHDGKPLISKTKIGAYDRTNKYMFQIPFEHLKTIKSKQNNSGTDLQISLEYPPRFYRKIEDKKVGHFSDSLKWEEFDTWFRQTDIMFDPYPLHRQKISLHKEMPDIDIGRWTTYIFRTEKLSDLMKQALSDFNISIVDVDQFNYVEPKKADLWSLIDPPNYSKNSQDLKTLDEGSDAIISLPFEVRYQLEVCISRDILNEYNITREFIQALANIASKNSLKAQSILEYIAGEGKRIYDPMTIFQNRDAMDRIIKTDIPHYCAYVRKATITPTTIYFNSPTLETTNRVLRRYARENRDGRFLRVQFTDELSQGRINPCADKTKDDELYTRVYRTLYNGIQIGDRNYEFLAFGGSQFRENGAYFFCPTEHLSCNEIRKWMGNFSHIPVVAKYAARLGQCFSTTRAINGLSKPDIVILPDIEREYDDGNRKKKYCFTDGVGKISPFLAQMIAVELGLYTKTVPSAFQFRLGGCKGILVVWPDAKDKEVHIRKSQQKFTAIYNGLEIIRCSRFSIATLNRQTITILSALGVEDNVFLKMLSDQLESYQNAMSDDELAMNLLLRYIDDNHMTINIATMIRNGFMTQKDPFVMSLLYLWRAWSIKLLKEKARIIVENGAFLFGCVDETGTLKGYTRPNVPFGQNPLEEDLPEIFIQIPDKNDPEQYNVIVGLCLIGRNPSLHPGDLRVVKAVDRPQLRHLRDVIVLPSNGDRDIASMCSGGDLDGDDYFVIWDKSLIPKEWNSEPMDFTAPEPKKKDRPVEITDLMKFFVRYMKNDTLRTIAPAHLANSDYLSRGVKDPICLELASLHSKAVDYVKSGEPAQMPSRLRPKRWPHFMEKTHKPKDFQYHSTKILGRIYDRVERVSFVPQWKHPFDQRILNSYKLDSSTLEAARQLKSQYDLAMRKVMNQQDIASEFEIWTTFVLSKPRVGSDYKLQEIIGEISNALKTQFKDACKEKAGGGEFDVLGPFVAAMYQVTKEEVDQAIVEHNSTQMVEDEEDSSKNVEPKQIPLISFPWLFERELGRIATGIDTSNKRSNLGLEPLILRDSSLRKRNEVGNTFDPEDHIVLNENGNIVRRGEMLDLFQNETEVNDRMADELKVETKNLAYLGLDERATALESVNSRLTETTRDYLAAGTGVEDVVPQKCLDGLIVSQVDEEPIYHWQDLHTIKSHVKNKNSRRPILPNPTFDNLEVSQISEITPVPPITQYVSKDGYCFNSEFPQANVSDSTQLINDESNTEVEEILISTSNLSSMDQLFEYLNNDLVDSDTDEIPEA